MRNRFSLLSSQSLLFYQIHAHKLPAFAWPLCDNPDKYIVYCVNMYRHCRFHAEFIILFSCLFFFTLFRFYCRCCCYCFEIVVNNFRRSVCFAHPQKHHHHLLRSHHFHKLSASIYNLKHILNKNGTHGDHHNHCTHIHNRTLISSDTRCEIILFID